MKLSPFEIYISSGNTDDEKELATPFVRQNGDIRALKEECGERAALLWKGRGTGHDEH